MKKWTSLALIALAGRADAVSVSPMSNLQIACYGKEHAVLAHVMDAHSYVCKKGAPGCYPYYAGATVVVDEVIAPSRAGVRTGDKIRVSFSVWQPVASLRLNDVQHSGSLMLPDNHADEITDDFVRSQLVG